MHAEYNHIGTHCKVDELVQTCVQHLRKSASRSQFIEIEVKRDMQLECRLVLLRYVHVVSLTVQIAIAYVHRSKICTH